MNEASLLERLQAIDPRVRLLPRRWLRRIIRRHLGMNASGKPAPHEDVYWIHSEELTRIADLTEIGLSGSMLPETILLLPALEEGENPDDPKILIRYWRWMFHAAIDQAIDQRLDAISFREQLLQLGGTTFHEARTVLEDMGRLLPPVTDRVIYREFVSYFCELYYFEPYLLPKIFPGVGSPELLLTSIQQQINMADFFGATQPKDALLPEKQDHHSQLLPMSEAQESAPLPTGERPGYRRAADRASEVGNDIRAAILFQQLRDRVEADNAMKRLLDRLTKVLDGIDPVIWQDMLQPLLHLAAQGDWPVAARLLYDLQKVCVEAERQLYAVDLVEWMVTFGKQPIRRRLHKPKDVHILKYLRSAVRHLDRLDFNYSHEPQLKKNLVEQIHMVEKKIRQQMRPELHAVLDEVQLIPTNTAEKLARNKLIEELLDVLCSRGYIRMSDVRDALARNRLKMNDLAGPKEWIMGDALIQANSKLAIRMDGVYRRGEIYLRWFQRLSSIFFGTKWGRLFTLYLGLPVFGAFIILEGLHHAIESIVDVGHLLTGYSTTLKAMGAVGSGMMPTLVRDPSAGTDTLATWPLISTVALFLLLLMHWPTFRHQVTKIAQKVFWEFPKAIWQSALLRSIFDNVVMRFIRRYLLTALVTGASSGLILRLLGYDLFSTGLASGGIALFTAAFFRTPLGRSLEERMNEWLTNVWSLISVNLITGLFATIMDFFRWMMEWIERGMYAVDEWFRFREGESSFAYAFKLIFGTFWFLITYVIRFSVMLLIEPQINPIKHFPVVTVSHKLLLPLIPSLSSTFGTTIETMTAIVAGIPGIFGFLVWELKENWKLYRANQSPTIDPVIVGSHGEKLRALLRPGFHSGVVPKTYRKLRHAIQDQDLPRIHKQEHALTHVEEYLHHLIERELLAYLRISRRWGGVPIHLEQIQLATNRIRIRFSVGSQHAPLILVFEERDGWVLAMVEESQALHSLSEKQQAAFADVLAGLYKQTGVHFVREQIAQTCQVPPQQFDCHPKGLILPSLERTLQYDSDEASQFLPTDPKEKPLAKKEILLQTTEISWSRWVDRWERDQSGKTPTEPLLPGWRLWL